MGPKVMTFPRAMSAARIRNSELHHYQVYVCGMIKFQFNVHNYRVLPSYRMVNVGLPSITLVLFYIQHT